MKKLYFILALFLVGCAAAHHEPTPTPEMLIAPHLIMRRPTETPYMTDFVITLTAIASRPYTPQTATAETYHSPANLAPPTAAPCIQIKGNNGSNGKIYHCPGWRDYNKTTVDKSEGDRWFCSEDEARAAGFREPEYSHGPCR